MANVKFVNAAGKYQDDTARHDLIHYMTQHKKIPNHIVCFSHGDISNAADQMTQTAQSFGKDHGVQPRPPADGFLEKLGAVSHKKA